MNILTSIESYFTDKQLPKTESSQKDSKQVSETFVQESPKLLRNSSETLQNTTKDGRSKQRSQKQIEAYKRNFTQRHKKKKIEQIVKIHPSKSIYENIFSSK
jgi:small-conductance mechanosensitive channel